MGDEEEMGEGDMKEENGWGRVVEERMMGSRRRREQIRLEGQQEERENREDSQRRGIERDRESRDDIEVQKVSRKKVEKIEKKEEYCRKKNNILEDYLQIFYNVLEI